MDYFELNRKSWDLRVATHVKSDFYDVPGFLAGATSLREIELAELGDVAGKRLLHLQCHFGLDTLSLQRMGAQCTGVDISPVAIEQAQALAKQTELGAQFVCSNVYAYERGDAPLFDVVFTSYGAVCWLPDLDRWARTIAANLKPGGTFYTVEFSPLYDLLVGYPYFGPSEPAVESSGTYTDDPDAVQAEYAVWTHPVGRVITALIGAGIEIEYVHEFPFSPYDCFPELTEQEPGRFVMTHQEHAVPIVYSIKGRRRA